MKRILFCTALLLSLLLLALPASAKDITKSVQKTGVPSEWLDDSYTTYASLAKEKEVTLRSDTPIASLYFRFDRLPASFLTVKTGEERKDVRVDYLHFFLSLTDLFGKSVDEVSLSFPDTKVSVADLFVFSEGELPDLVQRWEPMCEEADLVLCTTHADDEQLFFLGILPTYAGERGYEVQVVYFVNHNDVHDRPHELLNGLWTVGVRHYPMIGELKDAWDGSTKTLEYGYKTFAKQGYSEDDIVRMQVEMIRRFRPQVIVGHDLKGEYGHPQHMVNADSLVKALGHCGDPAYAAEGAPYTPQKVYLHLYGENQITMNWDLPLSAFGGRTGYEVSKDGYACHLSQQWTWFTGWIRGKTKPYYTSATQITKHFPTQFGLYFTTVGNDEEGGDFFEHLTPRSLTPPETEPVTEPATEPVTEPPTQPVTSPVTDLPTSPVTVPATDQPTSPVTAPSTDPSAAPEKAPVGGILLVCAGIAAIAAGWMAVRKKKK